MFILDTNGMHTHHLMFSTMQSVQGYLVVCCYILTTKQ